MESRCIFDIFLIGNKYVRLEILIGEGLTVISEMLAKYCNVKLHFHAWETKNIRSIPSYMPYAYTNESLPASIIYAERPLKNHAIFFNPGKPAKFGLRCNPIPAFP